MIAPAPTLIDHGAEFSADRVYRYRLWRRWAAGPMLVVIALNPSTADEAQDDPTIRRCLGYARDWGFAGLRMLNLFAFRATAPVVMMRAADPVGPDNRRLMASECRIAGYEGSPFKKARMTGVPVDAEGATPWGDLGFERLQDLLAACEDPEVYEFDLGSAHRSAKMAT